MRLTGRSKILFLTVLLCLSLFPGAALADQAPATESALTRQGTASATALRAINVRSGPDTGFWVVGVLQANETVPVLGVNAAGTWWRINTGFTQGWVSDRVVTVSNTAAVPVISGGTSVTVTTGEVNLRSGPGLGASVIGTLVNGSQVFLIGRSADGAWLNVTTQFGTGWIAAELTSAGATIVLDTTVEVTANQPTAVVQVETLNVRSGPGANYRILGTVTGGTRLPIIGSSADRTWFNVETVFGDGWVSDLYVFTENEFGGSPITSSTVDTTDLIVPVAIVNVEFLNVRSGPAATFTIVDEVNGGEQFDLVARNASFSWVLIDNGEFDGWVNRIFVVIRGDTSNLPIADSTTASTLTAPTTGDTITVNAEVPGPIAFVATGALNVRSGPNVAFEPLGFVYAATRMPIIGQSVDGNWWQVESPFGIGWVTKQLVIVENNALNVPVVQ